MGWKSVKKAPPIPRRFFGVSDNIELARDLLDTAHRLVASVSREFNIDYLQVACAKRRDNRVHHR